MRPVIFRSVRSWESGKDWEAVQDWKRPSTPEPQATYGPDSEAFFCKGTSGLTGGGAGFEWVWDWDAGVAPVCAPWFRCEGIRRRHPQIRHVDIWLLRAEGRVLCPPPILPKRMTGFPLRTGRTFCPSIVPGWEEGPVALRGVGTSQPSWDGSDRPWFSLLFPGHFPPVSHPLKPKPASFYQEDYMILPSLLLWISFIFCELPCK